MYIVPQQMLLYKYGIEFITEKVHQYLLQVGSNKNKKKMLNILNKNISICFHYARYNSQILLPTPNTLGVNNCEPCAQNI